MEKKDQDRHIEEWTEFSVLCDKNFKETRDRAWEFKGRCVDGLLTGTTLDYMS